MMVIPAIDLQGGKVVRLVQGRFDSTTIYHETPVACAEEWERQGAQRLHIVDLDGAQTGTLSNIKVIAQIAHATHLPIQCGGGVRSPGDIRRLRDSGVQYVIVGTKAFDEKFLRQAVDILSDRLIVSLDVKEGIVQIEGWTASCGEQPQQAATRLYGLGIRTVLCTDITRDGMLQGTNVDLLSCMLRETELDVILSGGVGSLNDIQKLNQIKDTRFIGIVVGKALYEKKFSLREAQAISLYSG